MVLTVEEMKKILNETKKLKQEIEKIIEDVDRHSIELIEIDMKIRENEKRIEKIKKKIRNRDRRSTIVHNICTFIEFIKKLKNYDINGIKDVEMLAREFSWKQLENTIYTMLNEVANILNKHDVDEEELIKANIEAEKTNETLKCLEQLLQ